MTNHLLLNANSLNAEILWALKVVLSHFSFRSCAELSELFQVMFSDSEIASEFTLGKTKCSYLISYGLAPYFKDTLFREISTSEFFSLSFDESLNKEIQSCQMDVGIKFWSDCTKLVETRYYDSQFLHRPNAVELFQSLLLSSQKLNEEKILQLAMDGPNVNWKVLEKLDNHRIENDFTKTLNIGSCSQHIIHGAFQNGAP